MSGPFTLESVDKDGAIQEMAHAVAGDTRADFMRKAVIAGGAFAGGAAVLAIPSIAKGQTPASDVAILNFALTLEYLEAAFYTEAVANRALRGATRRFANVVKAHEQTHVSFLKNALGRAAVARPRFDFKGTTEAQGVFQRTARILEDTGVMAYAGQAPLVKTDAILAAALSVHTVEARHASWIRHIIGQPPAPAVFDSPRTRAQILSAVGGTGFIVGAGAPTSVTGPPAFAG